MNDEDDVIEEQEEVENNLEIEDQEYQLHESTITTTTATRVEQISVGGKIFLEKTLMNKWFYILASTFLGCFYVFVVILAFLVKTTDGMNYAIGETDKNEQYTQIYQAVDEVEQEIRSKYNVSINKYLIISALTVFMNNQYYQNKSMAFNYVNVDDGASSKSTTVIKNFAEILAKYQIVTNTSCSMPSGTPRQIASNDDEGMKYFTTSASDKEKNYDCNGMGSQYKVSWKQGVLDDDSSGSAFYWNMLDENFFNNYYPEYFGQLTKNGSNPEQYYEAADEVLDYIYLYAKYLKQLDTKANSCADTTFTTIYQECAGVTVEPDADGKYGGTYSLEEYVAGVVADESSPQYSSLILSDTGHGNYAANEAVVNEAIKAFIIAIRSYTLSRTNGCTRTIKNSSGDQNFKPTNDPIILELVKETEGLVITYEGKVVSAEYDSFCGGKEKCRNQHCTDPYNCYYQKKPTEEKHLITMPSNFNRYYGGHGRGLSQWANVWYAYQKGWNYKQLLEFFYADGIQIQRLASASGGPSGLYCSNSSSGTQAKDFNELGDKAYNGDKTAQEEWIQRVGKIVQNAQHSKYGIKNSLIIAQIINESGWMHTPNHFNDDGTSLNNTCNNIIGINYQMGKPISSQDSRWSANPQKCPMSVPYWDSNDQLAYRVEDMRKYEDIEQCIEDYANLVYIYHPECKNNNNIECYRKFLDHYTPVPAGQETITERYIRIISMYNLERFDQ